MPRFLDRIWHIKGSVALAPGQSSADAFDRLAPLFDQPGTTHERRNDTLTFQKKGQAAQDKMSVFDGGVLRVETGAEPVLRYHLTSRALLLCFLAPLLFLAFAQITIVLAKFDKPSTEAAAKDAKAKKKDVVRRLNPIDKFLRAPEPKKPGKDGKDKDDKDKKQSPTSAYVFAGIFAALYLGGRVLEDRLVKSLFRKRLLGMQS